MKWRAFDTALWCYLFFPVLIFLPGFFVPMVGLPLALLALAAAAHWLPRLDPPARGLDRKPRYDVLALALLGVLAGAWAVMGGAGHVFFADPIDWVARFAVLRDLVVQDWPPRYLDAASNEFVLRTGLGYYLPAALIARAFGLPFADSLLLAWTWLGIFLFFAANFTGSPKQRLVGAGLFIFASGLDIVGAWSKTGMLPWAGAHLEWWAGRLQYSSNTTLLFWVPNHAFPGWIAAAWLWRFRDVPQFLVRLPILFLPVMLWAPLPAVGLFPLAVVAVALRWRECFLSRERLGELFKSLGLVTAPAGFIAAYLLMSAATIDFGTTEAALPAGADGGGDQIANTLYFFALEAGFFSVLALLRDRSALLIASVSVLALLPWVRFGPNNDLLMRGSIPALTMIWLVLIAELTAEPSKRELSKLMRVVLVFLFLVGMATPYQEIHRALTRKHWTPNPAISVPQATGGLAAHYFAPTKDSWLKPLFRN
jgi:hypothetical protein